MKEKILLAILPYWDPMIPPNGIAHLKAFLQNNGYEVITVDAIIEKQFKEIYQQYFEVLKTAVPESNWGNFYNYGHDVLRTQMMIHLNYTDRNDYNEIVDLIIYDTYQFNIGIENIEALFQIIEGFYTSLKLYITNLLIAEAPDVVGFTVYNATLPATIFAARVIKAFNPNIRTIIGGGVFVYTCPPGSRSFNSVLDFTKDCIDKIIIGQGELLFLKYLQNELPESERVYNKSHINNEILQFADMTLPDFSDFDLSNYSCLPATATSSCPYECKFCSSRLYYGNYREKDPVQTAKEMVSISKKSGHQLFFMTDALLNNVINHLSDELLQYNHSVYFDTYFRIDHKSAQIENTLLWRKAGMYRVRIGAESGSQKILDLMDKGITIDQMKSALSALAYAGIKTTTYWVIGYPGETEEDFQMTLDFIEEIKDDIYQAETNVFTYMGTFQGGNDSWSSYAQNIYPEKYDEQLVLEYRSLNIYPNRKEGYARACRFENHCRQLGIPNPYTLNEYNYADKRWSDLHHNAVPPLLDFLSKKEIISENKKISLVSHAINQRNAIEDFSF